MRARRIDHHLRAVVGVETASTRLAYGLQHPARRSPSALNQYGLAGWSNECEGMPTRRVQLRHRATQRLLNFSLGLSCADKADPGKFL